MTMEGPKLSEPLTGQNALNEGAGERNVYQLLEWRILGQPLHFQNGLHSRGNVWQAMHCRLKLL